MGKWKSLVAGIVLIYAAPIFAGESYLNAGNFYCNPQTNPNVSCCQILMLDRTFGRCAGGDRPNKLCDQDYIDANPGCTISDKLCCPNGGSCSRLEDEGITITRPKVVAACEDGESFFVETDFPAAATANWGVGYKISTTYVNSPSQVNICFDVRNSATAYAPFDSTWSSPHVDMNQPADVLAYYVTQPGFAFVPWKGAATGVTGASCTDMSCDGMSLFFKATLNQSSGCPNPITQGTILVYDQTLLW